MEHGKAQQIARQTMEFIRGAIQPGMHLTEARARCEAEMRRLGAGWFWYYGVGAF